MKYISLTLIIIIFCSLSLSADENFDKALELHKQNKFDEAIEYYTKSIDEDSTNIYSFYNRGLCYISTKDKTKAMFDFIKCTDLDSNHFEAFSNLTSIFVESKQYDEALIIAHELVRINKDDDKAYLVIGQLYLNLGNNIKACENLEKAKTLGNKVAEEIIEDVCVNVENEELGIDWPDEDKWKVGDVQTSGNTKVIDLIREGEDVDNWTELGNMTLVNGVRNQNVENTMDYLSKQSLVNSPDSKLTFIDKDLKAKYPWIMFKIENPFFKNDPRPESQIWYVIQGKQSLYMIFWAIKQKTISKENEDKWTNIFKNSKMINVKK